ncbi:putative bifunctional diguanylate cyclase/phosphodiesterase [Pleionea litopenaei]|uniref:EAL domain-containing protein n=1 Tax=Pleionea litopenaei TaxID=3070815 RepID=A0AA51RSM0_9GAMM|nr:EAL domain-containing protein [Pleionea sp. HL-JVS1]WMS86758.1 EAL domain-containing protein [Pleionea sp. HL-JVS1]
MNYVTSRAQILTMATLVVAIAISVFLLQQVNRHNAQQRVSSELSFFAQQFQADMRQQLANTSSLATLISELPLTDSQDTNRELLDDLTRNPSVKGVALMAGNRIVSSVGDVKQSTLLALYRSMETGQSSVIGFEQTQSDVMIARGILLAKQDGVAKWLFISLPLNAFSDFNKKLSHFFGEGVPYALSFKGVEAAPARPEISAQLNQQWLDDDNYSIELTEPSYQLSVLIPKSSISSLQIFSLLEVVLGTIALFLIVLIIVALLFYFRYLSPFNALLKEIQNTRFGEPINLKKRKGKGVVDRLINTYIDMLRKLNKMAAFDHLTGLSNRTHFQYQLHRQLKVSARHGKKMALLYIDLDNFKKVNDHYGHAVGDKLLKAFSERLLKSTRPSDLVANLTKGELARLAGDEFALLLTNIESNAVAEKVAERILSLFESGFLLDGVNHNVQASIGIVITPDDGNDVATLLQNADAAMYQAKLKGKNRLQFFNRDIAGGIQRKQFIERTLTKAIEHSHFHLVYMPIYSAVSREVVGVEVLIRAPTLTAKGIGPEEFIPVAESTGLIKAIDTWVLNESLSRLNYVSDRYGFDGFFAINISAVELHNKEFPGTVRSMLMKHQVVPERIELEITETSFVDNIEGSIRQLNHLKSLGVSLSLDDFGTGYTAFTQLIEFPVDKVKIDRSFIQGLSNSSTDKRRMVDIVLALADLYQLEVIAEGVENEAQIGYLKDRGCEMLQGFYLSKPLSWNDFQKLIEHAE